MARQKNNLLLLILGLLAALLFSATFLLNKSISIEGGHWFYSAFLRYFYTLLFLSILFILRYGVDFFKAVLSEYKNHFWFWTKAGFIGFGLFYAPICYAADHSPAWVLVTSWQFTIFASLFVLTFFGQKLTRTTIILTILVVVGISMVNISYFKISNIWQAFNASFPVIVASFAFAYGNQMVWQEQKKRTQDIALHNPFGVVFLLVLGSSFFWIGLFLFLDVGYPTSSQQISVAIIALVSGILATSLFLYARKSATCASEIMIVDATISAEVLFTLLSEVLFLNGALPNIWGFFGMAITMIALILMVVYGK